MNRYTEQQTMRGGKLIVSLTVDDTYRYVDAIFPAGQGRFKMTLPNAYAVRLSKASKTPHADLKLGP